jgi:RNA polymerase sigma factor (sigma-70 family)
MRHLHLSRRTLRKNVSGENDFLWRMVLNNSKVRELFLAMGKKVVDWKERTLAHWDKINALTVRRFGRGLLAEEAALAVINGLEADNWQRVRAFQGQAAFPSFLLAISARLVEDFARKRYGRVRPPLWVQAFGGIWHKLFQALCLERLSVNDAVEVVYQRQVAAEKMTIETAAYELLARIPDCGMARGLEVAFEEEEPTTNKGGGTGPADMIETREQKELFRAIFQLVLGQEQGAVGEELLKKYRMVKMHLGPEEKLLLRLCYQDGLGVSEAGEMLGMTRFQVHGRMRRLLQRLHAEFQRCGLAEVLRPMLEE